MAKPLAKDFRTQEGRFDRLRYCRSYNRWYRRTPIGAAKHKEFERQRAAQKLSAIATLKLETGCADCGYAEDPVALDFDHVGNDKVDGIARMVSKHLAIEDILAEAEKCEVVCANCHRVRTSVRQGGGGPSHS